MRSRHIRSTMTVMALAALSACAPVATYPSDSRDLTLKTIVPEPVPTLMAEAIDYACTTYDPDGNPSINLPAGTSMKLYDRVIAHLGTGHPQVDPDEPAISITKVRSRGFVGSVDLFIPDIDGSHSFATLTFRRDAFSGYRHIRTKWWDIAETPPAVNYIVLQQHDAPPAIDDDEPPAAQPVLAHD
ncbi:MAG: hypothetical protein IID28_02850 [Planctomycetes bacterium]|nr:hypothetical protein [Planctomycetota bacterium]